ncbi:P-loop NTPase fold protein [Rickettsiales bacterium LUAb2]
MKLTKNEAKNSKIEDDKFFIKETIDVVKSCIVESNNVVIGVTAPYGGGKTFFAECLKNELDDNSELTTIFINLWENDYKDPLITLIASLNSILTDDEQQKSLKESGKQIIKKFGFSLAKDLFSKFSNTIDVIDELLDNKEKDDIKNLKDTLTNIAASKKIVFLVDEIDRCKPEFAIEFLEKIKHFFNIDNIIFVLFINNEYLENLQDTYVGNKNSSANFMNKFINKLITLIPINWSKFLEKEFTAMYTDVYKQEISLKNKELSIEYITYFINYLNLSIREVKHIISNDIRLYKLLPYLKDENISLYSFKRAVRYDIGDTLLFLIYAIKLKYTSEFYKMIKHNNCLFLKKIIEDIKVRYKDELVASNINRERLLKMLLDWFINKFYKTVQYDDKNFNRILYENGLVPQNTLEDFKDGNILEWISTLRE